MLVTDPRRAFGRREGDDGRDSCQGSLFAPDALARPDKPPGRTPDPFAAQGPAPYPFAPPAGGEALARDVGDPAAPSAQTVARPPEAVAPTTEIVAPDFVAVGTHDDEPVDYMDDPEEFEPAHAHVEASRSVLAGPTLDDLMSRVWEGLRAEVPTPCPVCRTEIEPHAHGRCGGCGSTLA